MGENGFVCVLCICQAFLRKKVDANITIIYDKINIRKRKGTNKYEKRN